MFLSLNWQGLQSLALLACAAGVLSIRIPFKSELTLRDVTLSTNSSDPFAFQVLDFEGDAEIIYTANVTVAGQSFEVQLDTGSSDLWIDTQNVTLGSGANNTNITTKITYIDLDSASGDIFIAPAQFGNFSVPQQAFINAPGSNATADNDKGLLGLGPPPISQVNVKLNGTSFNGRTVMENIFAAYPNESTYITFSLNRTNLGISDGGVFTIGETASNLSQITNQTKIPIMQGLDQWIALMDGMIVNGQNYTGHGLLSKVPVADASVKNQTLALFDTGTALGFVPNYYFDAMYKHIPGIKELSKQLGIYDIPCDTKFNVSMIFNGTEYPINPLDLTRLVTVDKKTICVNTFSPQSLKTEAQQVTDFILGDAFLRNVYILYNYGNWTNSSTEQPYVQLLSTTNQTEAWTQFDFLNQVRMQQWSSLGGQFNTTN